jgi:hypothetical protein
MITRRLQVMRAGAFARLLLAAVAVAALSSPSAWAQTELDSAVVYKIGSLLEEKEARSGTQQKLDSQLWYALQWSRGQALPGLDEMYGNALAAARQDASGRTQVTVRGVVSDRLLGRIAALGGAVKFSSQSAQAIVAVVPLAALETLAEDADVSRIARSARPKHNVGALTSQGYITHKANQVVAGGRDGTGVTVGVLSDSVDALAAMIATGDLPADTIVVPGQDGVPGSSEGTAMMEIVHDLAPGAKLVFATAFGSDVSFAANIVALRDVYHCDIIVDDVTYSEEGVFQDGLIAQAVNDVTASGALYFSSAGNSGNVTSATSGTWEGDFVPGPASGAPLPAGYTLHNFTPTQAFNRNLAATDDISVQWSDPLGGSTNDYDLFILNSAGTTVSCSSTTVQTGTGDPIEECVANAGFPANSRIVVAKKAGAAVRALHVSTFGESQLTSSTTGATFGHNAARNTVTLAATYWNSARTGTRPFVGGAANPTEAFSSDGPRKIFFNPDGSAITPGNFVFATNGGLTLTKPDFAAADGVSAKTPGFLPFFGTSAAAPHAAAIAALVKSARPDYNSAQILNAMRQTALDIRAAGLDRDSGYGIVMALEAVNYALTH